MSAEHAPGAVQLGHVRRHEGGDGQAEELLLPAAQRLARRRVAVHDEVVRAAQELEPPLRVPGAGGRRRARAVGSAAQQSLFVERTALVALAGREAARSARRAGRRGGQHAHDGAAGLAAVLGQGGGVSPVGTFVRLGLLQNGGAPDEVRSRLSTLPGVVVHATGVGSLPAATVPLLLHASAKQRRSSKCYWRFLLASEETNRIRRRELSKTRTATAKLIP